PFEHHPRSATRHHNQPHRDPPRHLQIQRRHDAHTSRRPTLGLPVPRLPRDALLVLLLRWPPGNSVHNPTRFRGRCKAALHPRSLKPNNNPLVSLLRLASTPAPSPHLVPQQDQILPPHHQHHQCTNQTPTSSRGHKAPQPTPQPSRDRNHPGVPARDPARGPAPQGRVPPPAADGPLRRRRRRGAHGGHEPVAVPGPQPRHQQRRHAGLRRRAGLDLGGGRGQPDGRHGGLCGRAGCVCCCWGWGGV
ncbi:hypothetical protein BR93DRAFT_976407, partial [Coniochaeta sp. PMI_546]